MNTRVTVAIGGFGAIGEALARTLVAGDDPELDRLALTALSARDLEAAKVRATAICPSAEIVASDQLAAHAEVVVECAPAAAFRSIAEPAVKAGRVLVTVSVGALLEHFDLVDIARTTGAQIMVPSGALMGLDAMRAAREGSITSVEMVTRKPPTGLTGVAFLEDQGIDVLSISEPTRVFSGTAREGAMKFPANVNVAAALGLAGVGPDATRLEVWVDPTVTRNTHQITVRSDTADFQFRIENVPSTANPRTGRIVAPSIVATLRRLVSPLVVGT